LSLNAGQVDSSISQTLIFPKPGTSSDKIRVDLAIPGNLIGAGVFSKITLTVYNGKNKIGQSYNLTNSILDVRILSGEKRSITFPVNGNFDRVKIEISSGLVNLDTQVDIYGAKIIAANEN